MEVGRSPLDTPERRADLRVRLREHINHIGDRDVRRFYAEDFQAREAKLFKQPGAARPFTPGPRGRRWRGPGPPSERLRKNRPEGTAPPARRRDRSESTVLRRPGAHEPPL